MRYAHPTNLILNGARYAFAAGYLPELEPRNRVDDIKRLMADAWYEETDPYWKDMLVRGEDDEGRMLIYESWLKYRKSIESAGNA